MKKIFTLVILFTTLFSMKGFSQAFPPVVNSFTDSVGSNYVNVYLNYTANDTGIIKAQIQLQKGTGNNVFDSTYSFPAPVTDPGYIQLNVTSLTPCTDYQLLLNMSNHNAQGSVINPLFQFTTICTTAIASLNENNYSLIAQTQSIEVKAFDVPKNEMIEIYDLAGRLILTTSLHQSIQQIPFNQNAGIYLLRITGKGQLLYTNRFVIF